MIKVHIVSPTELRVNSSKENETKLQVQKSQLVKSNIKSNSKVRIRKVESSKAEVISDGNVVVVDKGVIYNGEYKVNPKPFSETVLKTQNKTLLNDITVLEIPYFETSNKFGSTVYIGAETEIK